MEAITPAGVASLGTVFGMALAQSVGIPIPAVLVLAPLGVLVARGDLPLWGICLAYVSGQTLGDMCAYGLTRIASPRLNRIFPRLYSRTEHPLIRKLFSKGHGPALLLAYFLSWFRPVVSYLAPVLGVPFGPFVGWSLLRNVIGNTTYVLVVTGGVQLFITQPAARPWLVVAGILAGGLMYWRWRQGAQRPEPDSAIHP